MLLKVLSTGDKVHRYGKSIVVAFNGNRRVLSTSPHLGGYQEGLKFVFNHDGTVGAGIASTLRAPTYEEHIALIAFELGLDPETTAGITTAAQMENVSFRTESHNELTVTAIVTGGIETNGGRVGDPASWDELMSLKDDTTSIRKEPSISKSDNIEHNEPTDGTINIILHINTDLSQGALTRALVTCTEAKTAAIQELLAPSKYSMELATGSGTDGTFIIANSDSRYQLTNAGKHSKTGELIGNAVKAAVKEALQLQTGLSPETQHNVLCRASRFGITNDSLWERYSGILSRADFEIELENLSADSALVTYTSLYCHLLDQLMWRLITLEEAVTAGTELLKLMGISVSDINPISKLGSGLPIMIGMLKCGLLELLESR